MVLWRCWGGRIGQAEKKREIWVQMVGQGEREEWVRDEEGHEWESLRNVVETRSCTHTDLK